MSLLKEKSAVRRFHIWRLAPEGTRKMARAAGVGLEKPDYPRVSQVAGCLGNRSAQRSAGAGFFHCPGRGGTLRLGGEGTNRAGNFGGST